jgi:hypothetical protein
MNVMKQLLLINLLMLIAVSEICAQISSDETNDTRFFHSGCSIITVSKGDSVFFGGNDDYINPDSYYWVEPGDSSRYGVIWIGTPDNPQQGINEKGLAYDANGLPRVDVNPHSERIPVKGEYYHHYVMQIMHECSLVEEVISWVNLHQHYPYMHDQLHFADATGDAVIISAGEDGELVFTRKPLGDGFLVSTNFNVANHSNNFGYPCWRYDKANELLGPLLETEDPISLRDVTSVMDAVHMEKGSSWTIETMVADLVHGEVYLYYFFQYDRPVVLNVKHELSNPREPGPLSKLFPVDVQEEAARRYHAARANLRTNIIVGISWPVTVLVSLILLFLNRGLFKKGIRFWITAVLFLGPVAFVAGFFALKRSKTTLCQSAVIETLGNLVPVVVAFTAGIAMLILNMLSGNVSWKVQMSIMIFLPIILGLVFHMAFLSPLSKENDGRLLLQCLPPVLVITLTGLGGITSVALPLVNKSLNMSLLIPLSPWPMITWWAIVVLGALPAGLLIFLYQRWALKNDFRAWTILTAGEGEIMMPEWGKLWWWILISLGILIAGLMIGLLLINNGS